MEASFLYALVLIFGVSALTIFVLHRVKVPPLVGFIVAGVIIGPNGLGLIEDTEAIEVLAEIGVILLLFTIGIEFSLQNLLKMRRTVLLGGGGQVFITIGATMAVSYFLTGDLNASIFFGFLASLSSTAIVLKTLTERGEMDTPHGRMMLGVLIFQDLCVVPLMLFIPALSGGGIDFPFIGSTLLKALGIILTVLLSARWVVPVIMYRIVRTKSRELFLITIIFICLGTALLTARFGLSLALGAFIAGLVISESEYAYEATAEILPFKEGFMGLFFISIGMLVNISSIAEHWFLVLGAVGFILLVKVLTSFVPLLLASSSGRASLHAGIGLAQIGEFSFILAAAGKAAGLMTESTFQLFLSASVATMVLTPFLLRAAHPASVWLISRKPFRRLRGEEGEETFSEKISGHAIVVGFGLNGRNLAHTLRKSKVNYVVLEMNNDTVIREKKQGEPIYFGDATSVEILRKMGVRRARVLVVVISDAASARKIVSIARREHPSLHIIVRTRYLVEVEDLIALGANEVIPEEFETSVEIFSRVLRHYNVPRNVINDVIEEIRKNAYEALRTHEVRTKPFIERHEMISNIETEAYLVKEDSNLPGHTLRELNIRARTGATVIAVQREEEIHENPHATFTFQKNDILLLVGKKEEIERSIAYIESEEYLTEKY
jgi:CPA2 family monovalent cation:H+ antiporter-2